MYHVMKPILLLSAVSLLCYSCSENVADMLVERKADAEKKFKQFYACYAIAKETPPLQMDQINWEMDDATIAYEESNVYQISMENFKDLSKPLNIPYDGTRRKEHADIAKLFNIDLSSYRQNHSYKVNERYKFHKPESEFVLPAIKHFLNTKYLIINRTHNVTEPKQIDNKTFSSGYINGDALIFDVEKGKLLGGITFTVQSDEFIKLMSKDSDVGANLRADIELNIRNQIQHKFANLTPSIKDSSFSL